MAEPHFLQSIALRIIKLSRGWPFKVPGIGT